MNFVCILKNKLQYVFTCLCGKKVAITLYYLSDEGRHRKTGNAFGVSRPCVSVIIRRVTRAIATYLGPKYIALPLTADAVNDKRTKIFQYLWSSSVYWSH